jgi:hypothetical protein
MSEQRDLFGRLDHLDAQTGRINDKLDSIGDGVRDARDLLRGRQDATGYRLRAIRAEQEQPEGREGLNLQQALTAVGLGVAAFGALAAALAGLIKIVHP